MGPLQNHPHQPNRAQPKELIRQKTSFLTELSKVMIEKGNALPPNFTGVPNPDFDVKTWKSLADSTKEPGIFRLQGTDIDIRQLWYLVQQLGGRHKVRYR